MFMWLILYLFFASFFGTKVLMVHLSRIEGVSRSSLVLFFSQLSES